ncbi:MAG TPA: response regulator [Reyranella sp.]|jgi:DNA-binding response OmpR family regulator
MPPLSHDALTGLKILVVEDSFLIAEHVSELLSEYGCVVVGPVGRLAAGLKLVEDGTAVDGAVLDVNLDGEFCFPIAAALVRRAVPFLFLTGYDDSDIIPGDFAAAPRLGKPLDEAQLVRTVATDFARR